MCFHVHPDHREPKTATRSIRVWKRFETVRQAPDGSTVMLSPYRAFPYHMGQEYSQAGPLMPTATTIERGFHSHDSLESALDRRDRTVDTDHVIECTVPKGATYYWNPDKNEIVSDRIVLKTIPVTRKLKLHQSFNGVKAPYDYRQG